MRKLIIKLELNFIIKLVCADNYDVARSRAKLARLLYDGAEVVPSWHDFSMTGQKSCQVDTTLV